MSNKNNSYEYHVDEFSQDIRCFQVIANRKLPEEVVRAVYYEVENIHEINTEDVTKSTWEELNRYGYGKDKYFEGLECTTSFLGTDYGDSELQIQYDYNPTFYKEKEIPEEKKDVKILSNHQADFLKEE